MTTAHLSNAERALIYDLLDRIRDDPKFRESLISCPEEVFNVATPKMTYSQLLAPEVLHVIGQLKRVALEEIGLDVAAYRDELLDNGFGFTTTEEK